MQLNVQTISTQAGTAVPVVLDAPCSAVLVKNFGNYDIWVSTDAEATKTLGMVRIPPDTAQVIKKNPPGVLDVDPWIQNLYITADEAMTDAVEIQPVG